MRSNRNIAIAGATAGLVNGLFGAGGGMILVPLLAAMTDLEDREVFPTSVSIMLPMCLVSLSISSIYTPIPWLEAFPYLIGSIIGGIFSGVLGKKIPTMWLHRGLGILILYGGIRYLC